MGIRNERERPKELERTFKGLGMRLERKGMERTDLNHVEDKLNQFLDTDITPKK